LTNPNIELARIAGSGTRTRLSRGTGLYFLAKEQDGPVYEIRQLVDDKHLDHL